MEWRSTTLLLEPAYVLGKSEYAMISIYLPSASTVSFWTWDGNLLEDKVLQLLLTQTHVISFPPTPLAFMSSMTAIRMIWVFKLAADVHVLES